MNKVMSLMAVAAAYAPATFFPSGAHASAALSCEPSPHYIARATRDGGAHARMCAVRSLDEVRYGQGSGAYASFNDVQGHVRSLANFYAARSDRQQLFMDGGAFFTGAGTLGYALSGPAGVTTQSYWGYGALLPIILVQFNANEPTRDLFFAGRVALDLLSDRYTFFNTRLNTLNALKNQRIDLTEICYQAEIHLQEVRQWNAGDDKAAILPNMEAVAERCRALNTNATSLSLTTTLAGAWKNDAPRRYATDALQLEHLIAERDAQLRTSPTEALTMLVSTPLRALDTLISGENAQAALNTIKLQDALAGITLPLSAADLPSPPKRLDVPLTVTAAANARGSISRPKEPLSPVPRALRWLNQATSILEDARTVQNEEIRWAADLYSASQASLLTFSYDTAGRRIQVTLQAPGAQLPAT